MSNKKCVTTFFFALLKFKF